DASSFETPRYRAAPQDEALCRRDIFPERVVLALELREPVLHHVADRYDAGEPPAIEHRHMAEAVLGHALHEVRDRLVFRAGHHVARHGAGDRLRQHITAMRGKLMDDVT